MRKEVKYYLRDTIGNIILYRGNESFLDSWNTEQKKWYPWRSFENVSQLKRLSGHIITEVPLKYIKLQGIPLD